VRSASGDLAAGSFTPFHPLLDSDDLDRQELQMDEGRENELAEIVTSLHLRQVSPEFSRLP
jgi:hypothetical protein